MNTTTPTLDDLRPELIEQVRHLPADQLAALRNYLLDLEINRLASEVDQQADEDRLAGRLAPETIEAAIREYRTRNPYP